MQIKLVKNKTFVSVYRNIDKLFFMGLIVSFLIITINNLVDMYIIAFYVFAILLVLYVRSFLGKVAFKIYVNTDEYEITFFPLRGKAISYSIKDLLQISVNYHIEFIMPKSKIYWHSPDFKDTSTIKLLEILSPFVKVKWGLLSRLNDSYEAVREQFNNNYKT